jgi:hypothetical protein
LYETCYYYQVVVINAIGYANSAFKLKNDLIMESGWKLAEHSEHRDHWHSKLVCY